MDKQFIVDEAYSPDGSHEQYKIESVMNQNGGYSLVVFIESDINKTPVIDPIKFIDGKTLKDMLSASQSQRGKQIEMLVKNGLSEVIESAKAKIDQYDKTRKTELP